jgi:hypothetical protein
MAEAIAAPASTQKAALIPVCDRRSGRAHYLTSSMWHLAGSIWPGRVVGELSKPLRPRLAPAPTPQP